MAISQADILEAVSNMTVMEIVDLISAMEEKFGVLLLLQWLLLLLRLPQ